MWEYHDFDSAHIWPEKREMFIKDKTQVTSRVSGIEIAIMYFTLDNEPIIFGVIWIRVRIQDFSFLYEIK